MVQATADVAATAAVGRSAMTSARLAVPVSRSTTAAWAASIRSARRWVVMSTR